MYFNLRLKLQIPISVAFVKESFFISFGIVPRRELFEIVSTISWFQFRFDGSLWRFRKIKCLGLTGKEGDILVSNCLLLARFYIFSCKYKSSKPSIVE